VEKNIQMSTFLKCVLCISVYLTGLCSFMTKHTFTKWIMLQKKYFFLYFIKYTAYQICCILLYMSAYFEAVCFNISFISYEQFNPYPANVENTASS
jgi:hypothetical protein